jgi:hypothetical protein
MNHAILPGIFILITLLIPTAGRTEPPLKKPTVSASDIALSDLPLPALHTGTHPRFLVEKKH